MLVDKSSTVDKRMCWRYEIRQNKQKLRGQTFGSCSLSFRPRSNRKSRRISGHRFVSLRVRRKKTVFFSLRNFSFSIRPDKLERRISRKLFVAKKENCRRSTKISEFSLRRARRCSFESVQLEEQSAGAQLETLFAWISNQNQSRKNTKRKNENFLSLNVKRWKNSISKQMFNSCRTHSDFVLTDNTFQTMFPKFSFNESTKFDEKTYFYSRRIKFSFLVSRKASKKPSNNWPNSFVVTSPDWPVFSFFSTPNNFSMNNFLQCRMKIIRKSEIQFLRQFWRKFLVKLNSSSTIRFYRWCIKMGERSSLLH